MAVASAGRSVDLTLTTSALATDTELPIGAHGRRHEP
jgi:hypothetical protein